MAKKAETNETAEIMESMENMKTAVLDGFEEKAEEPVRKEESPSAAEEKPEDTEAEKLSEADEADEADKTDDAESTEEIEDTEEESDTDTIIRQSESTGRRTGRLIEDDTTYFAERKDELKVMLAKLERARRNEEIIGAEIEQISINHQQKRVDIKARINDAFSVTIPDYEFFMDNSFLASYEKASDDVKLKRRYERARAKMYAWIPIIIVQTGFDRQTDSYFVFGSRKRAMLKRQEKYFGGRNPLVKVNDEVTAEVLSVGEHFADLEVCGVECQLSPGNITAKRFVADCRDELKSGDRIKVAVKVIHKNPDGTVKLNVSGSMVGYRKMMENSKIVKADDVFSGFVRDYSAKSGTYTVVTNTGALVAVSDRSVLGSDILIKGDAVTVVVTHMGKSGLPWGTARKRGSLA